MLLPLKTLPQITYWLDPWINWLRHPQLMQSATLSPGIQELLLLVRVYKLRRKSKESRKTLFFYISQKSYKVQTWNSAQNTHIKWVKGVHFPKVLNVGFLSIQYMNIGLNVNFILIKFSEKCQINRAFILLFFGFSPKFMYQE